MKFILGFYLFYCESSGDIKLDKIFNR